MIFFKNFEEIIKKSQEIVRKIEMNFTVVLVFKITIRESFGEILKENHECFFYFFKNYSTFFSKLL